jgi:Ca2+-binding RTX toxin-like protein
LQNLTIKSSTDGDIEMGLIGARDFFGDFGDNPSDLETITIDAAVSSTITQWGIDADDSITGNGSASTVNTINITGGRSSTINLFGSALGTNSLTNDRGANVQGPVFKAGSVTGDNWLQSASIGTVMINTSGLVQGEIDAAYDMNDGGFAETVFNNLIGLDQQVQQGGSNVMVSGSGNVTGLYFQDEVAALVDATGLTSTAPNHAVDLSEATNGLTTGYDIDVPQNNTYTFAVLANDPHNAPASKGFTFRGTESGDLVFATNSADTLAGNGGADLLVGYGGADSIDGGAGNDVLFGDSMDPNRGLAGNATAVGNDMIVGGAGNDWIIGGGNAANKAGTLETLTGGAGLDVFAYVFDSASLVNALVANPAYTEAGKSTQLALGGQDVITDFTPGVDTIQIDAVNADNSYAIAYYASQTAVATNIGSIAAQDVQIVIRRGDYNANGTFNQSATGADYQVLFAANGDDFSATMAARNVIFPGAFAGGGTDFTEAVHEIGILGLAAMGGSLTTSDFVFV